MSSASYGIVVEGTYDKPFFEELIRRITSPDVEIPSYDTGGIPRFHGKFPGYLRALEHVRGGEPVDKAFVIRDSGGRDPAFVERELRDRIQNKHFSFPRGIQLHAVRRAMETWLLADVGAINTVAASRGGRSIPAVKENPEDIFDPKEKLKRMLSEARLPYDPEVCRQIASHVRMDILKDRCPSFRAFEQKVLDC